MTSSTEKKGPVAALVVAAVGLGVAGASFLLGARVTLYGYLAAFTFWLGPPLGCAGLVMTHRLTGGRWGWSVIRPARAAALSIPVLAIAFIPVAAGLWRIYPWAIGGVEGGEADLWFRRMYLSPGFFLARAAGFLMIWLVGAWWLFRPRQAQGGRAWTPRSEAAAAFGLIVLVLTVTFAGTDWIGSLTVRWYSSIFGFYLLTSFGLTGVAVLILSTGAADAEPEPEVLADLGNLLLTFVILHAYMAFSQYLITWTGNQPHEAGYYQPRRQAVWVALACLIVCIQFFLPLAALLVRVVKRRRKALAKVAWVVLASQALEAGWLVLPSLTLPGRSAGYTAAVTAIPAAGALAGIGGLWVAWFEWTRRAARAGGGVRP